ncbi:MAG: DUF1190 domain-containing protein [Hyphomicrobiaceae bacterium]
MKRSRYVALVGMGASAVLLTACEDPNEMLAAKAYDSVSACVTDGNDQATCSNAFYAAQDSYNTNYPRYESQYDCEDNAGIGKCEPDYPNARNHAWRPMMTGFLMGAAMNSRVKPQPLVSNEKSESRRSTVGGVFIVSRGFNTSVPARAAKPATSSQIAKAHAVASTKARGGFGSTASRVSSSGYPGRVGG